MPKPPSGGGFGTRRLNKRSVSRCKLHKASKFVCFYGHLANIKFTLQTVSPKTLAQLALLTIALRALWMRRTVARPEIALTLRLGFLPIVRFRFRVQSPPCTLVASPVLLPTFFLAASSLTLFQPVMRDKTDAADLAPLSLPCSTARDFAHQLRTLSVDQWRPQELANLRGGQIKTLTS